MLIRQLAITALLLSSSVGIAEEQKPTTGTLKGTVRVTGAIPGLPPLVKAAANVPDESLVINEKENNALANVAIWMRSAPHGYEPSRPEKTVMKIVRGRFEPHVQAIRVNQQIDVQNQGAVAHVVHTSPFHSREFNWKFAPGAPNKGFHYDKAERVPIKVKDDLHPWMSAYHIVTDHPFVAISDTKGAFEIKDIPASSHEFTIWHERPGYLVRTKTIEIKAGETTTLDLKYDIEKLK